MFRLLYTEGGQPKVKVAYNGDDYSYSSFGEAKNKELYVCNLTDGSIYHIIDPTAGLVGNIPGNAAEKNSLDLSPNPSKGNFNIVYTSAKAEQVTLRITNILGGQVYIASKAVNTGKNAWNVNVNLLKGNYYLTIVNTAGSVVTQSLRID